MILGAFSSTLSLFSLNHFLPDKQGCSLELSLELALPLLDHRSDKSESIEVSPIQGEPEVEKHEAPAEVAPVPKCVLAH